MPKPIRETARLLEADTAQPGRQLVQLISPGWGSSGYYSTEVLEQAVADMVIPAGTHMYADHPTETEDIERPGRSIKDLMSVTVEDARVATTTDVDAGADQGAVVAEVRVAAPYRDLVKDLAEDIGLSIRGDASDITIGEAEGRTGRIIEGLAHVQSVDWVTKAGRGGRVLSLMESARATQRAVRRGLNESTVNDTREALSVALRDAHGGGDTTWVWVRDFDDSTVWFEIEGEGDANGIYAQAYTQSDGGAVELTGERTEVRVVTTYVPATRPDGTKSEESEEDTMPKIQIEESEHTRLVEAAGRVDALTSENTTLKADNDQFRAAEAAGKRDTRARELVTERATAAGVTFDDLQVRGLIADLPLNEAGDLDETVFAASVDTAAAKVKEGQTGGGGGDPHGFGGTPGVTEAQRPTTNPWGRSLTEQKGA